MKNHVEAIIPKRTSSLSDNMDTDNEINISGVSFLSGILYLIRPTF